MNSKFKSLKSLLVFVVLCVALGLTAGCSRESKKAKYLQRAETQFKAGDYDRAEIEYMNLLRLDPTNQIARRNLAVMSFEQGKAVRAYVLLSEARKAFPEDFEIRYKFALSLLSVGKPKEAREEAVQILSQQPTNQDALVLLAESSISTNDLNDARQRLASLKSAAGESAGYHVAWATLHLRNRDSKAAEQSARQALKSDPKSSAAHAAMGTWHLIDKDSTNALAEFKAASELAPARSHFHMRYADALSGAGDSAAAKALLEGISKETPDYLPALLRLGQIALADRRFADCEGILKSLLGRDPTHLEGLMTLARLRIAQNQPDNAIQEYERVLQTFPRLPQAHYQMAIAYLLRNDLSSAVKNLNDALSVSPDYPEAILLLAEINIRRGDTASAVTGLTKLVERHPNLPRAQTLLATAYRAAGRLDSAFAIYENFSRSFPTNPQPVFMMGVVRLQQGRKAEARASFEKSLTLSPDLLSAVEQLLNLDLAERNIAAARERAQREVDRAPTNATPYLLLAQVHLAETNTASAESALMKALELSPESRAANTLLAQVYVFTKRQEEAMKKLQEMVARNTNDVASWMLIAQLNDAISNHVAAGKAYEAILAVNPKHGPALNNLAWLCSEHLKEPKRAYELASRARNLNPRDPSTADTFGWVLYHLGDYSRALALIQESAQTRSEQPEVLFHLGMTHYMLGEESAARVALQSALQLGVGDAPWKPQAQERLRVLDIDPAKADANAVKELQEMSARAPRDPIVLARLGDVLERQDALEKAADAYEGALQLSTNLVPVMVKLAQLYSRNPKNPSRAFALAKRARSLEPNDPGIAHTLGRLAYGSAQTSSDYRWAYALLQEGARASGDDPDVLFDFALASYAVGEVTNAANAMRKSLELKPASPRAEDAAQFLEMNGLLARPEEAAAAAARVAAILRARPDYVPALLVNGLIQERKQDFAAARSTYERVLKLFPSFTPVNKSLAILYSTHLNDAQKAYDYATKAREAFPQDLQVARVLGELEYRRGEYPRAAQLLKESAPAFSNDAEFYYTLGMAHYKLKQSRETREALNKALAMLPTSRQASEARRILAELK